MNLQKYHLKGSMFPGSAICKRIKLDAESLNNITLFSLKGGVANQLPTRLNLPLNQYWNISFPKKNSL